MDESNGGRKKGIAGPLSSPCSGKDSQDFPIARNNRLVSYDSRESRGKKKRENRDETNAD